MSSEGDVMDEAKKAAKKINEEINETADKVSETVSNAVDEAKEDVAEAIDGAVDQASDAVSQVGEDVAEALSDAAQEADETAADKIAEITDDASQAVGEAGEAVEEASQVAADKVSEAIAAGAPADTQSNELDALVEKLQAATPTNIADSQYSPVGLLTLLQEYFPKLPADLQSRILDLFQGMDAKDLVSLETWKGVVIMVLNSAKTQAEQVAGMADSVLPDPLKSSNLLGLFQSAVDKFTPSIVKGAASSAKDIAANLGSMASNLEGMSAEDLLAPETWKGLYYMLDMGLRSQVTLLKERVTGGGEEEEGGGDDDFDDWDDWEE